MYRARCRSRAETSRLCRRAPERQSSLLCESTHWQDRHLRADAPRRCQAPSAQEDHSGCGTDRGRVSRTSVGSRIGLRNCGLERTLETLEGIEVVLRGLAGAQLVPALTLHGAAVTR